MLTVEQRAQLDRTGTVRVPGVVDRAEANGMADKVWASLAQRGILRNDPATWPAGFVGKNQALRKASAFDAFRNERTAAIVDELLGSWHDGDAWGPALVTFPQPGRWTLPHTMWHLDVPGCGDPDQPDVARLFGYVSDVGQHGGATLVVEGSHELVRRMVAAAPGHDAGSSADVRKRLAASHPWFRALLSAKGDDRNRVQQFTVDGDEIDGVHVRVAELTADAGDIVVMAPWTLHNLSMNTATTPRFVVTRSIYRTTSRISRSAT